MTGLGVMSEKQEGQSYKMDYLVFDVETSFFIAGTKALPPIEQAIALLERNPHTNQSDIDEAIKILKEFT
jgi:hypothetical protein